MLQRHSCCNFSLLPFKADHLPYQIIPSSQVCGTLFSLYLPLQYSLLQFHSKFSGCIWRLEYQYVMTELNWVLISIYLQFRAAIMSMIYQKSLKISLTGRNQGISIGDVSNLFAVDADTIKDFVWYSFTYLLPLFVNMFLQGYSYWITHNIA